MCASQPDAHVCKQLAVLGLIDGRQLGANQLNVVLLQNAALRADTRDDNKAPGRQTLHPIDIDHGCQGCPFLPHPA